MFQILSLHSNFKVVQTPNQEPMCWVVSVGTGKTIAFLLPLLERHFRERTRPRAPPTIIILEPTRELTLQVINELEGLANRVQSCACYGGASINVQSKFYQNILKLLRLSFNHE
jgi:superfamily II DNA/RNA helicase